MPLAKNPSEADMGTMPVCDFRFFCPYYKEAVNWQSVIRLLTN